MALIRWFRLAKKWVLFSAAAVLLAMVSLPSGFAVSANTFSWDKSSYNPGDSGTAKLTVYNDQSSLIRVTSVDISFGYYYQDGRVYSQDFISPALSMNVTQGTSSQPINIQFNLPSNIATGYFTPSITVSYNVLNGGTFGNTRQANSAASAPLLVSSASAQTTMYLFVATTVLFAVVAGYFAMRYFAVKAPANRSRND